MLKNERIISEIQRLANVGYWELDLKTNKFEYSENLIKICLGDYDFEYDITSFIDIVHPNDRKRVVELIKTSKLEKKMEYTFCTRVNNLEERYIEVVISHSVNSKGEYTKAFGIVKDVTKRVQTENLLYITEQRFKDAQKLTKFGNFEADLINNTAYWSDEIYNIIEVDKNKEAPSQELLDSFIYKDDRKHFLSSVESIKDGGYSHVIYRIQTRKGKIKYIEEHFFCVKDIENNIYKYYGTAQDITEKKLAENKIRISEKRLQTAQRITKLGNWEIDVKDNKKLHWSNEIYRIFGLIPNSVTPSVELFLSFVHPDDLEMVKSNLSKLYNGGYYVIDFRIVQRDGVEKYVQEHGYCKRNSDDEITFYFGTTQDITAIKQKEIELQHSKEIIQLAAKLSKLEYWEYNLDKDEFIMHKLYTESLDAEFIKSNPSFDAFVERLDLDESIRIVKLVTELINTGEGIETEIRVPKDYGDIWLQVRAECYYSNNKLIKLYGYLKDVTKEHVYKQELIEAKLNAEKSERLKTAFLANMSHEIRTPMNSIMGLSELLLSYDCTNQETKEYSSKIYKNSQQLVDIIQDILDLSVLEIGETQCEYSEVSVNTLIDKLYRKYTERDFSNIELRKKNLTNDISIVSDDEILSKIISNFMSNAFKYTSEGFIEIGAKIIDNNKLSIYVQDTGVGLTEECLDDVFNHFHKIDKFKEGIGVGLSISKGLAKLLKVELRVESELNVGSIFSVEIPIN